MAPLYKAQSETIMTELSDDMANVIEQTRLRMLHALEVFPFISASMLHQAIGTSTSTALWRPLLTQLLEEKLVQEDTIQAKTPTGRSQSYTIYHLPHNKYDFAG